VAFFTLALAVGLGAGKDEKVDASLFVAQSPEQAAENLLGKAMNQAGKGTWERIAVARVHFLAGETERGQQIIDGIPVEKRDASDWIRIGRVYWAAGDWDKAREAFDWVVEEKPKDEDWLAEIGAYYNLKGERAKAEQLFERSFEEDPDNLYNTLAVAGSYLGVEKQ